MVNVSVKILGGRGGVLNESAFHFAFGVCSKKSQAQEVRTFVALKCKNARHFAQGADRVKSVALTAKLEGEVSHFF